MIQLGTVYMKKDVSRERMNHPLWDDSKKYSWWRRCRRNDPACERKKNVSRAADANLAREIRRTLPIHKMALQSFSTFKCFFTQSKSNEITRNSPYIYCFVKIWSQNPWSHFPRWRPTVFHYEGKSNMEPNTTSHIHDLYQVFQARRINWIFRKMLFNHYSNRKKLI